MRRRIIHDVLDHLVVAAGREGATLAPKKHHPDIGIGVDRGPQVNELEVPALGDRVELGGIVEGDDEDSIRPLIQLQELILTLIHDATVMV